MINNSEYAYRFQQSMNTGFPFQRFAYKALIQSPLKTIDY